jgi:ubiquinone/menaquinone biosynthesis C-methylase UbiE
MQIGCFTAEQLLDLRKSFPDKLFFGIDINNSAVLYVNDLIEKNNIINLNVINSSVVNLSKSIHSQNCVTFSFACLMYIDSNNIEAAILNIYRITRKYIVIIEIFSEDDGTASELFCLPRNWKRNYKFYFDKLNLNYKNITISSLSDNIWSPGGGGASIMIVEL